MQVLRLIGYQQTFWDHYLKPARGIATFHIYEKVEIFAVPDETAATYATVLLNECICRYGCPLALHTDQGETLMVKSPKELCELLEIRKTRTSPRNPKCNGVTERFNSILLTMIRSYIKGQQRN